MLEKFVGMTEVQIRVRYSLLSNTDKEQFQRELLPFMNMLAKTMLDSGAVVKPTDEVKAVACKEIGCTGVDENCPGNPKCSMLRKVMEE